MDAEGHSRPFTLYLLIVVLLFLCINALAGGAVLATGDALKMPQDWLEGTPFSNYFIPGLLLFTIFGVGGLAVLYALWTRPHAPWLASLTAWTGAHWAWAAAGAFGMILAVGIAVLVKVSGTFHPLYLAIIALGVLIVALDMLPGVRRYYRHGVESGVSLDVTPSFY